MEVRPGYIQTEVGIIPKEWDQQPVGRIIERLDAGVSVNSVEDSDSFGYNKFILKTSAVREGKFLPLERKKIATHDLWRVSLRPRADTILISRMNTSELVGECGYVEVDHKDLYLPDRLWMAQKSSTSDASIRWLSYSLSSRFQKDRIKALATGTSGSMKNLAKDSFLDLPIAVPKPAEQRAIAKALSDVDALLDGLDRLIAKKRDLNMAAMQQLLTGQTRLPGFCGEWEMKRIADVALPSSERNVAGETLPVLACSKHFGFVDSLGFFKNQVFSKDLSTYRVIRRGEIGYPANHVEEGSIGLQDLYDTALVSPIYVVFRVAEETSSFFLHRLLKLDSYRQQFRIATTSSVDRRGSLRWPAFSEITIRLPPTKDEQTAISTVLSDMEQELAVLEARRDKTRNLKQAMMQELLTGKTRLM